jgi:hypothetical protein
MGVGLSVRESEGPLMLHVVCAIFAAIGLLLIYIAVMGYLRERSRRG